MQPFRDDTLFACLNVEKKHRILQKENKEFGDKDNDVNKSKLSHSAIKREILRKDESDIGKYFDDSVISLNVNSGKNSTSNILKKDKILISQNNRNSYKISSKNTNVNCLNKKRPFNTIKENDELNIEHFQKNKFRDNEKDTISNSYVATSANNCTYDKESSGSILYLPLCTQDRCKLGSWGLPPNILQKYIAHGVENMFTWQMECLSNHKIMQDKQNLVYSAPTSAGKTLIAEILLIKTVLERQKKDLLSDSGIRVEGFMGGAAPPGGFAATQIAIATIEKANSLVNRLMEENDLSSLGAVVIDELHLLGDTHRGYLLELLLTKLKYMTIRNDDINIQLIGMSATLPNLSLLAKWLDAELYKTEFRPIPLNEYCKIGPNIYDNKFSLVRKLAVLPELEADADNILQLCIETINAGHSVLIFCPTKKWCEKLAQQLAATFFKLGCGNTTSGEMLKKEINPELIYETLEQLKRSPSGLDSILKSTISFGIAFHHAGLTMEERDIIEGSFRTGSLRVLIATSTLSSGVNLPARRVIIRSPMFGSNLLNTLTYKQMIGRAGRMGKDSTGESILICKPNERNAATSLLSATLDPIESCLNNSTLLIRALLEAIASEVLYTSEDLELYINCTLLSLSDPSDVQTFSNKAIKFLLDNEFLLLQTTEKESRWIATSLGKACLAASVPPREGLFLFEELQKARRCFVLDTELHVVYLVTPLSTGSQIENVDWMTFHELWNTMSESERRVGRLVGVEERFLLSAIRGIVRSGKLLNIHKRFYSALALHELVNEVPLNAVCKKYGCCRGVLQTLQQSASTYAGMVTQFCKQLRWDCMELLISQFQTRLQFGVCRELLDLLRLPMLNGLRARSLYKQGITCVADLAVANELNVERALYNALPFESEKDQEGEYALETEKRNKVRTVFVTGRDGLTPQQAAILLVQEARVLVQKELGLEQLPWEQNERSLQVNTQAGNIKDTPSTQEQSQVRIDTDGSTSTKEGVSVAENSLCSKPASRENQKGDISSTNTCKETVETKLVLEKKKMSESLISLENDQDSSNFRDISSPDLIEDDEDLNNSKEKENDSEIDNSSKTKRRNKEEKDITLNMPKKKLKISSSNRVENIDEKQTDKNTSVSILNTHVKSSCSRSPSLFDDSLNLDTQMCDILEQNVMDLSGLEDSSAFESRSNVTSTLQKKSVGPSDDSVQTCNDNNSDAHVPADTAHLLPKNSVLSWDDDSWNSFAELSKKVVENNVQNMSKEVFQGKIKDIVNTSASIIPRNVKAQNNKEDPCDMGVKKSTTVASNKEKALLKSKLLKITSSQSPVTNVIVFRGSERKTSVDSNRSDSDNIIVASQHFESPFSGNKNRTKTQLERRIHTMRSQKLTENTKEMNNRVNSPMGGVPSGAAEDSAQKRMKPKLKEILPQDFASGSVIYDSEEEAAVGSTKPVFRVIQRHETQLSVSREKVKPKIEIVSRSDNNMDLSSETVDWNTLNIVKVANNRAIFSLFKREVLKKRSVAFALHCDAYNTNNIGSRVCVTDSGKKRKLKKPVNYTYGSTEIRGAAISWEKNIAYYISLINAQDSKISVKEQMILLKELLSDTALYVKCFAAKNTYKLLYLCCGISAKCRFLDPMIAHWLYTNSSERNFNEMVMQYFPEGNFIMKRTNSYSNVGPGMDMRSSLPGEFRSAAEAVLIWHMADSITNKLEELNPVLLHTFRDTEMRIAAILACMELSGIGVNVKTLQELSSVVLNEMQSLETKAYDLAGRKFNLSSSKEVGQVLGLYKDKKVSTSKAVLEKCDNPISRLVILWRKLSATKTKIIYPLLNLSQQDSRIHGNCLTCTVTGRVSMQEPNLQNVPKDFRFGDNNLVVGVRKAFVPALGNVMLSADYCQLELRLLTHFSQDLVLCEIMKQQGDIFKNIAAKWNNVTEEEVTNEMRQRTKQLCYGMIYGMGVKSLAENLCISEADAQHFLESFMSAYPGIYKWLDVTLEKAHHDGYVTTLLGRRRQLPDLRSTKSSTRAQAERQAVNTKVQGSAADIVKKAMINIEERMRQNFPDSAVIFPEVQDARKLRSNGRDMLQRGGYLVLQLHDELLYEVNLADLKEVAIIIKESMEEVCQLTVPLPVKVRVGPAWGSLTDYKF
ncbi:PREDICTED: DNA polymerase theta isoform X2 [Dinoponera quadriceps]|uniref:DNA polymerase theta isoform X2 n=1 Tax=Dinoponera quadriceps TaxID=609295 RepID=A0A6P3WU99_DINQU|nr:PREDICTED: DNA polymerase theta isoform X2 [Dinoponera quadriceps]